MKNVNQTLYTKDSKGRIRQWEIMTKGASYFTRDGIRGMKIKEWVENTCKGKNAGRSNATTDEEQAISEAENLIAKKLKENYFKTVEEASGAKSFRPMLADKWKDRAAKVTYPGIIQPKLDGARCNIYDNGGLKAYSREGREFFSCPHIIEAVRPIFEKYPNIILDGELYNHKLHNNFEDLMSIVRKSKPAPEDLAFSRANLQYHIYDVYLPDSPTMDNAARNVVLVIIKGLINQECVQFVENNTIQHPSEIELFMKTYLEKGYEGIMFRSATGVYKVDGRSKDLLKVKEFTDDEFEIVSIEEGSGTWAGHAKMINVKLPDGRTCGAGLKGTQESAKKIWENQSKYIGKKATVTYFGKTADGMLRLPIAKDLDRKE
jgi:DNA ligase-1